MQSALRGTMYFLSFILFVYGLSNLVEQYKAGEEFSWSVPVIFLCIGTGVPLLLVLFPTLFQFEDSEEDSFGDDAENHDA